MLTIPALFTFSRISLYIWMIEMIDINNDVVRLEMLDAKMRIDTVKSLKGPFIFERITCDNCLTQVNPLCPKVLVNKRVIRVGATTNTVLEPQCPVCGNFIPAEQFFHILN
jgi:hypothetical protein